MRAAFALLLVVALTVSAMTCCTADTPDPRVALDRLKLPPGGYQLSWDPDREWWSPKHDWHPDGTDPMVTDKPDPRISKLPKFASDKPKYVILRLDGFGPEGLVAAAIDESGGTGTGYDRAYIDCNRNWDLSDETPCYVRHEKPQPFLSFSLGDLDGVDPVRARDSDWVKVSPAKPGGREIALRLLPYDLDNLENRTCGALRRGDWTCRLRTNLGELDLRLTDTNCDGVYGDTAPCKGGVGDRIQINEMRLPGYESVNAEIDVTPVVRIGRRLLAISANESRLSIRPYGGATGKLQVTGGTLSGRRCGVALIGLTGRETGPIELMELGSGPITLPVGTYSFQSCRAIVSAPGGAKMGVDCKFGEQFSRTVVASRPTLVRLGGKVSAALSPEKKSLVFTAGETPDYQWTIKLGDAMTVYSISVKDLAAPALQFKDLSGRIAATATSAFT